MAVGEWDGGEREELLVGDGDRKTEESRIGNELIESLVQLNRSYKTLLAFQSIS
jgi:hypothetical protein